MKKSEAIKLIDNLYTSIQKFRSNAAETLDGFNVDEILPELCEESKNPNRLTLFGAISRAKNLSDIGIVEPITIYNLVYLIDKNFYPLRAFSELLGFTIPPCSIRLSIGFDQE